MHKFVPLFTTISILYRQNSFSIHSSVNVQEEQINMPKQNLQNLGDKAHFPRAQKLQNTIVQFITFLSWCQSVFSSVQKCSPLKILKASDSILAGVKIQHLWRVPNGHGKVIVSLFLAFSEVDSARSSYIFVSLSLAHRILDSKLPKVKGLS